MDDNERAADEQVSRLLATLAPDDHPDPRRAFQQFQSRIEFSRRDSITMFGIQLSRKVQRGLAVGLSIAALVGLLAVPQVQAFASGFLSIFRVEKFVLVNVSQARIDQIQKAVGSDSSMGKHVVIKDGGQPVQVATLAAAASKVGFTPLSADASYGAPTRVEIKGQEIQRFEPDVKAIRSVYTALGLDPSLIPDNIDGKPFDITVPAGVAQTYGSSDKSITLAQVPSPTLKAPDGVDAEKLGEAMLQLLGMSPDEAARMSKSIDWTSTLVIPVPQGLDSVQEVTVRGVSGLLYEGGSGPKHKTMPEGQPAAAPEYSVSLVWQANGYLYAVAGSSPAQVSAFAEGLH